MSQISAYRLLSIAVLIPLLLCLLSEPAPAQEFQSGGVQPARTVVPVLLDPNQNYNNIRSDKSLSELGKVVNLPSAITINYLPPGPDPYGVGDNCTAWPTAARTAFTSAVTLWTGKLKSTVPISIDACWADNLPTGPQGTVLSHSGPIFIALEEETGTWYAIALANALTGVKLNAGYNDIYTCFNSLVPWYFGTDGNPPAGEVDFVTVVTHEIAHGLGFIGSMRVLSGQGYWGIDGYPLVYDRFAADGSGNGLLNTAIYPNPSVALGNALTGGAVFSNGSKTITANGGTPARLYVPSPWQSGSSYSHLDYATYVNTPNALMVPAISSGRAIHDQGPVAMGILQDLGWELAPDSLPPTVVSTVPVNGATGAGVTSVVRATFSEAMNPATITPDTFTLMHGSTAVTGSISYDAATKTATFTPAADLSGSTLYTATITMGAQDSAGNPLAAPHSWSFTTQPLQQTLAVTLAGNGTGTVTSIPEGITCSSGTCVALFDANTLVTLTATPSSSSLFTGWSGACTNTTGDCNLTMNSAQSVTATFVVMPPVRIAGPPCTYFWSLADAIAVVPTGETIQAQATVLTENVSLSRSVSVNFKGGYDSSYGSVVGRTILKGRLAISRGRLAVRHLAIR